MQKSIQLGTGVKKKETVPILRSFNLWKGQIQISTILAIRHTHTHKDIHIQNNVWVQKEEKINGMEQKYAQ